MTLVNNSDYSLLGTNPNGVNNSSIDEPAYTAGPLQINHNPRNGNSYFNTSLFSLQPLGTPGNSPRRFFYGPGAENYDISLSKTVPLSETTAVAFRAEAFNVFNHTQFFGPSSVNAVLGSSSLGKSSPLPRLASCNWLSNSLFETRSVDRTFLRLHIFSLHSNISYDIL